MKRYFSLIDKWGEDGKSHFQATKDGGDYRPGPKSKTHQGVFFALKNRRPTEIRTPEGLSKEIYALVDKRLEAL